MSLRKFLSKLRSGLPDSVPRQLPISFTSAASLGLGTIRRSALWARDDRIGVVVATTRGVALYRFERADGSWTQAWFRATAAWAISVSVSSDGRRVAAATHDGRVTIWDAGSGEQVAELAGQGKTLVALDPRGERVALGDKTGVTLWSVVTGERQCQLAGTSQEVTALAFHPAGGRVAAADYSGQALIWDASTGRELRRWKHAGPVRALAFFPDGGRLAATGKDLTIWDIEMDMQVHSATAPGPMVSVAVAAGGERLLTGTARNRALLWDLATGEHTTLATHLDEIHSVAFVLRDDLVMLASQKLHLLDLRTGALMPAVPAFARPVAARVASTDGGDTIAIADKQVITLWSYSGRSGAVLDGHTHTIKNLWFRDHGQIVSHSPREVIGWDAATGARRWTVDAPAGVGGAAMDQAAMGQAAMGQAAMGQDRPHLAVALEREDAIRLVLCDPDSGDELREIATMRRRGTGVHELALSPDASALAVRESSRITVWDVAGGSQRFTIDLPVNRDGAMIWSPGGDVLATGLTTGEVVLWDGRAGRKRHVLQGGGDRATLLAYSDDGTLLAGAFKARPADQIFVWDVRAGKSIHGPLQGGQVCHALALRPDNSTLVAGFSDGQQSGSWMSWHLATGDVIDQHPGESIWAVAFGDHGRVLVTATGDGVATIWTTTPNTR
jgi:WD40 repeat protein